ncbi:MAG TPA: protease pro-enzyme activation domain-containing protein, partial [Candidatus Acidoferrales bacterium]|nr:protease pro-enzyme activation domain-containing protein [Candidatus Acidoferrales bacterium]
MPLRIARAAILPVIFLSCASMAHAQDASIRQRITQKIDERQMTTLRGNVHPMAKAEFDHGAAPADLELNRMMLLLKRSPEQEKALQQLMEQQQTKGSPNYQKWLTPAQFGAQFGPSDADIQTVTSWLGSHGFQVTKVTAGKTMIEFSGNASQVKGAFHTEIHRFVVNGEEHWANASDPQIPAALTPVVAGVHSLHNFFRKPLIQKVGYFQKSKKDGSVTPLFTFNPNGGQTLNALGPTD